MMDWGGGRGPGMMWGGGLPMHSGMMPMMMMAMMDTDENGSISYEEIEAVHRRMFNLVDKDKNGELSPEEIQEVMGRRFERRDDGDDDDDAN
jgi:Ca2+-binding EF-hand superfamily protein